MAALSSVSSKTSPAQRIAGLMQDLQNLRAIDATEERFQEICARTISIPISSRPAALISMIAQVFGKQPTSVQAALRTNTGTTDFDTLIPASGWLRDYIEWTRNTEPPTVFHFFAGAVTLGASLARRVFFDKGAYQVFPSMAVMILAPSGICRKTSACNLATGLFVKSGGKMYADKTTPEALAERLAVSAQGLIYAPELAVFLGKQKYNDGLVPALTAWLDCPEEWKGDTIGRGELVLTKVAISALMCSTVDWLQTSVAPDIFGGGFMSRFMFVVQESTPRSFPLPPPLDADARKALIARLVKLRALKGEFRMTPEAERWYVDWYKSKTRTASPDKHFAGYYERKPDHALRLAMVLRAQEPNVEGPQDLVLHPSHLIHASRILSWLEDWMPGAFDQMASSVAGEDQLRILKQLKEAGGRMEHSMLLRKNSRRLNAMRFKDAVSTLREAHLIEFDPPTHSYLLTPEGWV